MIHAYVRQWRPGDADRFTEILSTEEVDITILRDRLLNNDIICVLKPPFATHSYDIDTDKTKWESRFVLPNNSRAVHLHCEGKQIYHITITWLGPKPDPPDLGSII